MYCKNCGKELSDSAFLCPNCGHPTQVTSSTSIPADASDKEWLPTVLLCFFLGHFGVHSFYVGKTGVGIAQLLTCGGCGIWTLIDFIFILMKSYRDADGRLVVR